LISSQENYSNEENGIKMFSKQRMSYTYFTLIFNHLV